MNFLKCRSCCVDWLKKAEWFPPLLARITIAGVFAIAGWGKLNNLAKVTEYFTMLGIPAPQLQAPFVAGVEFFCGLLVLVGLCTRLASVPLIGTMVVALITAKRENISSLFDLFEMSEYLYVPLLIYLIVFGPGRVSVDYFLAKKFQA